jgi:hypothetical protein
MVFGRSLPALAFAVAILGATGPVAAEPVASAGRPQAGRSRAEAKGLSRSQMGGIVVFAISYGLALGVPMVRGFRDGREWLAAPIVGPPMGIVKRVGLPWALVLDEVGQVLGSVLIAVSDPISWTSTAGLASPGRACPALGVCVQRRF